MEGYDHKEIEKKWQKKWEEEGQNKISDHVEGKENFYTLVEFTYPSGNLHVGHWYAFAVPDIYARFKRMQGYNVLYPMGFDAFGLPAENAAIKLGADPKVWTYEQMDRMRDQFRTMGAIFPWDREVVSCDPKYYKWTQWMFTQFLKNDLAYRAVTKVNWCPKDQTILANEQVVNGCCERCGSEVLQRDQEQWMLRITKYADKLVDDLDTLAWPEEIKAAQRNWIGRTEGAEIDFPVNGQEHAVKVFTTRPDTIFGATYIGVSAGLAKAWLDMGWPADQTIKDYIAATLKEKGVRDFKEKEKTGIYAGFGAINPATKEEIPIWITNYVLNDIGTGAIMGVPAHDERDFDFAKKYNLPIKQVIARETGQKKENEEFKDGGAGVIFDPISQKYAVADLGGGKSLFFAGGVNSGENVQEGVMREIKEESGLHNFRYVEKIETSYAHYFNTLKKINRVARAECFLVILENTNTLPVKLEEHEKFSLVWKDAKEIKDWWIKNDDEDGFKHYIRFLDEAVARAIELGYDTTSDPKEFKATPITIDGILEYSGKFNGLTSEEARKKITEFVGGKMVKTYRLRDWGISRQRYWGVPIPIVYDPEGKAHPVPDEHLPWLLPADVDHTPDGTSPLARSKELLERTEKIFGAGWKPEVETMDTFVDSSWYFYRYLDNQNDTEFAAKEKIDSWMPVDLYMGGAEHTTMHLLYSRFWVKALHGLGLVEDNEAYTVRRNRGLILGPDGNKMSKSKGNVINPDEIVDRLGADTVRMYLAFMGPYGVTTNYPWDPNGVVGVRRFLERVWKLKYKIDTAKKVCKTDSLVHKTIKGVTEDIEEYKFNTAIAKMMILVNALEKEEAIVENSYKMLLRLLSPFAPHITDELSHNIGETESIHISAWPEFDTKLAQDQEVTIAIQINGKTRGTVMVPHGSDQETVEAAARAEENTAKHLIGEPNKVVFVKDRLINFVL